MCYKGTLSKVDIQPELCRWQYIVSIIDTRVPPQHLRKINGVLVLVWKDLNKLGLGD
jgi:hypothetical protein